MILAEVGRSLAESAWREMIGATVFGWKVPGPSTRILRLHRLGL